MKQDERLTGNVFLVLELVHDRSERYGGVSLVASVPGREGTYGRRWKAPYGILSEAQAADLAAHLTKQAMDALVLFTGVQTTLEV